MWLGGSAGTGGNDKSGFHLVCYDASAVCNIQQLQNRCMMFGSGNDGKNPLATMGTSCSLFTFFVHFGPDRRGQEQLAGIVSDI